MSEESTNNNPAPQPSQPAQPVVPPPPRDTGEGSWQTRGLTPDNIQTK